MYISAKFSNWPFKRNILRKMIVLGNRQINIFPNICILSLMRISCQERAVNSQNASQLGPAPCLWGVEIKTSAKTDRFWAKKNSSKYHQFCPFLFQRPPIGIKKAYLQYFPRKFSKTVQKVLFKSTNVGQTFTL